MAMSTEVKEKVDKLQSLIDIQSDDGNWNYDPYMHGMLNGMLVAKAVFDDENAEFKEAPDKWIRDIELLEKFNESGAVIK